MPLDLLMARYFNNLKVAEVTAVYGEADKGSNLMPALQSCSAWIDMEQPKLFVVEDLEDMAVTGDEELGRVCVDLLADEWVVMSWIAADVCHQYFYPFA